MVEWLLTRNLKLKRGRVAKPGEILNLLTFVSLATSRIKIHVDATISSLLIQCVQHSLIQPAFHSRHCLLMLLKARFVFRAAQTRVLLVAGLLGRCCSSC